MRNIPSRPLPDIGELATSRGTMELMTERGNKLWQMSKHEIWAKFTTDERGLSSEEVQARSSKFGLNRLTPKPPPPLWRIYLRQFQNSLILVLLAAVGLILIIWLFDRQSADLTEAGLILAIILLITILGFWQEAKAERTLLELRKILSNNALVKRNGRESRIEAEKLVPGDIVILEEGMTVPADLRIFEQSELSINESSLTGEALPSTKTAAPLSGDLALADRDNLAYSATQVVSGRALAVVVATGNQTEIGRLANQVAEIEEPPTPIQVRLDRIGRVISLTVTVIAVGVMIVIFLFDRDFQRLTLAERLIQSLIVAVALAVAAIPEGLPAVVTINLAIGTRRLLKKNILTRRLAAVETLGSTDTICVDKTGTLTMGEMTVTELFFNRRLVPVTGHGYEIKGQLTGQFQLTEAKLLLKIGLNCNNAALNADEVIGDPTEIALLVSAGKMALTRRLKRIKELPFSAKRKMMSVVCQEGRGRLVLSKGAPEVILEHCRQIVINGRLRRLTPQDRTEILDNVERLSGQARRVLAFAYKTHQPSRAIEEGLVFVGLQAMTDPPRSEVKQLIERCQTAGIRVMMITGDHIATAKAVGQQIGLVGSAVLGSEIAQLSPPELSALLSQTDILARVSPGDKALIVAALKKQGRIVAMTGDGINDAPALKQADIGVAMGKTGSDVSKEAADMILLDDHFATIVAAIEEGRGIFDNIRKFVHYLLSSNLAEVLIIVGGILIFNDLVLTAVMLLWVNIVTDGFPALALAADPTDHKIMKRQPAEFQENILTPAIWRQMIGASVIITGGVLGIFALTRDSATGQTAAFLTLVILELVQLLAVRSRYHQGLLSNHYLVLAILGTLLLQLVIHLTPFGRGLFDLDDLPTTVWLVIIAGSFLVMALLKVVNRWSGFKPIVAGAND